MNQDRRDGMKDRLNKWDISDISIPSSSARKGNLESPTTKTNTKSSRTSKISAYSIVDEDPFLENELEVQKKISKELFIVRDRFDLTPANSKKNNCFFNIRQKYPINEFLRSKSLEKYHLDKVEEQKNEEEPIQKKRLDLKRIGRRKISLPTDGNEFNRKLTERRKALHYEEDSPIKEDVLEFEDIRRRPCSVSHLNRSSQRTLRVDEIDKMKKYFYEYEDEKGKEKIDNIIVENPEAEKEEKLKITKLERIFGKLEDENTYMKNIVRNDPDEIGFDSLDSNRSNNRYSQIQNLNEDLQKSSINEIEEKSD